MPDSSNIKSIQSPSHPISVTIGNTSTGAAQGAAMSLQKASASLSLGTVELDKDFVLQIVATNTANPVAVLETHPTIPNQRALMATLVPKFNLPASRPEIVFLCDRSGSMGDGKRIPNLQAALRVFLKSLPLGVKFNICSFGSRHEFLFKKGSRSYDASSLDEAIRHVDRFAADFGGTEMYRPMEDIFKKRYADMELELFLLTDGEIWDQASLYEMMNKYISASKGAIRVFPLGIGSAVSHSLIEGVARAGNGFAQTVGDNEKMNNKVVRMLKASLTPHVKDYVLEVKYGREPARTAEDDSDDDFEIIEKVMDALAIDVPESQPGGAEPQARAVPNKPISLFDTSADVDAEMTDASLGSSASGKYSHVPPVSEPKFLQAPFNIPPLFPFSRTSVYLLLSPETTQRTPKSVILRGTSIHGPLELEIPVTVLAEKGQTIHQLAAKKAVLELEEGRGWIYQAKDAKGPNGKLLKDKFLGRFSDMVEREAVRLGVAFQVGGKWCSFVAVENGNERESAQETTPAQVPDKNKKTRKGGVDTRALSISSEPLARMHTVAKAAISADLSQASPQLSHVSSPRAKGVPGMVSSLARRSVAALGGGQQMMQQQQQQQQQRGAMSFGAAPVVGQQMMAMQMPQPQSMALGAPPPPPQPAPAPMSKRKPAKLPSFMSKKRTTSVDEKYDQDDAMVLANYEISAPESATEGGKEEQTLEALVALQTFTGAWDWNSKLLKTLGLVEKDVKAKAKSASLYPRPDLLATALVLAYLQARLAGQQDEWEMLADKARDWMQGELASLGALSAEEYIENFKGLF
ncbi:von Willebrand factor type A domain-containing protein [Lasiosphaeria miniovina]|uniref:von Willebrand factor type A domain-containing protein n=1 Tax=Lasiosphaeria miniovina TaxID=1954250 RepID=A0AA40DXN5_9PEZI|nr:von Willebrand factor type A domain-containing protein [Lasiosphaeria miniovina]KAK0716841.1 von Willebrand factor type A domain-containing protein [Lasiosphaeria miniovina]